MQGRAQDRIFQALHEIAVAIGGVLEPVALAQLVAGHARELLGGDTVTLRLWDEEHGALRVLFSWPLSPPVIEYMPGGGGSVGQAFQRRETVIATDYQGLPQAMVETLERGVRSTIAVPLIVADVAIGTLVVGFSRPDEAAPEQAQTLELLAAQVAPALAAAQALNREHQTREVAAARAAELAASEARLRTLYTAMACGIMVQDHHGAILDVNPAGEEVLGRSLEQMRGHQLDDLFEAYDQDGRPLTPSARPSAVARQQRQQVRSRTIAVRRSDGALRWLLVNVVPLAEPDVEAPRTISSFIDITDLRQAEAALRESEARKGAMLEAAPTCIITIDDQGRVLEFNPAAEQTFGYRRDQAIGRDLAELIIPPDQRERHRQGLARYRTSAQSVTAGRRLELEACRADGSRLPVELVVTPIQVAGRPAFMGYLQDISARKEAERQLLQLAESEKLRALGQMASGIAHDLNQALALVSGHGDLALAEVERPLSDKRTLREQLRVMIEAAMDGAASVRRLLTFARSRAEGEAELVNLGALLQELAQLTAPRWRDTAQNEGRPIELSALASGTTTILGWPSSLREALTNLVFNAVDALPNGGTIRLSACRDGAQVVVEVADSGVGIPAEVQSRLFEPFFTTKGERGTGLGLAQVYAIVEQHGGEIGLESQPGQGTIFRLTFPAASGAPTESAVPALVEPTRRLRVLAVDDEPALARLLTLLLGQAGHDATPASSAEEALERLAGQPFDLVISDLGLGLGQSGWDLAAAVRRHWPEVRFILATGWGAEIEPELARNRGVEAVIAKPYRLADFQRLS